MTLALDTSAKLDFANETTTGDIERLMDRLTDHFHFASAARGWWIDPITGFSLLPYDNNRPGYEASTNSEIMRTAWFPYVVATKMALIHSEVSEMLEAHRLGGTSSIDTEPSAVDDHIGMLGIVAESADVMIRIFDLLGMMKRVYPNYSFSVGRALVLKGRFNAIRPDHSIENRRKSGGKKY